MRELMANAIIERTKEAIASIPAILLTVGLLYGTLRILDAILIPYVLGY
jgi:hypothetical protein